MLLFDKKITEKWWQDLIEYPDRMNNWLQKLQVTEADGYVGNFEVNAKWNPTGIRKVETFLIQTARDELRHSNILEEVFEIRGIKRLEDQTPTSIYWDRMEAEANSLEDMLAVFYLGEQLASERFEIIRNNPKTPVEVSYFIDRALPDEMMHAQGYKTLAGEEAVEKMYKVHLKVMDHILAGRK